MDDEQLHHSVLLEESITALNIRPNGKYVDGTFGRGGHSRMILQHLNEEGRLLVMDKDPAAISYAQQKLANDSRAYIYSGSFADMHHIVAEQNWLGQIDGVLLDLGVSSPQLDEAQRGFSFRADGPLDMRMDTSHGQTAAQWLAQAKSDEIAYVLKTYGEERFARRIANAIVKQRIEQPINTTKALATIIAHAIPTREKNKDPATRSFQAIRIFINQELDELQQCLAKVLEVLAPGGRLVVISFHSLEDRIVKQFIRQQSKGDDYPPDLPITHVQIKTHMRSIGKAIKPGHVEVAHNPRARSAVLRIAEKL